MESLPFWEMQPHNELVKSGLALCLAKQDEAYALYLPEGGEIEVELPSDSVFNIAWWNPVNGRTGRVENEGRSSSGPLKLTAPGAGDWAVRLYKPTHTHSPTALSASTSRPQNGIAPVADAETALRDLAAQAIAAADELSVRSKADR